MTGRGWGFGDVSEVEGKGQCGISEQVSLRSKKLGLKNGAFGGQDSRCVAAAADAAGLENNHGCAWVACSQGRGHSERPCFRGSPVAVIRKMAGGEWGENCEPGLIIRPTGNCMCGLEAFDTLFFEP